MGVESARQTVQGRAGRKARARFLLLLPFLLAFAFFPVACALYNPASFVEQKSNPKAIPITAPQVTLAWDPPASGASNVTSYIVSFRIHGTTSWTTLATIPAVPQPSYTVLYSAVGAGSFDFGVTAVSSTGVDSAEHTSLDATADPTTGWYLNWWGP